MPERPAPTAGALAKRFGLLGLIVTVLVALLGILAPTASASTLPHAQTRVAAIERPADQIVGPHETVLPGQGRPRAPNYDQSATGSSVAAEGGASGVVRHYTTDAAAESISKSGTIEPGINSGKIWLTPDEYTTGAEAQGKLALNKTPGGYFEIPICRVECPSAPSVVEPFYGQPGGGIEITTSFPIDVIDLPFIRFGG